MARRWWGWGVEEGRCPTDPDFWPWLERRLGGPFRPCARPDLSAIEIPRPRALPAGVLPSVAIQTDPPSRIAHAAGKSYRDLIALRRGRPERAPDAVLFPETDAAVEQILRRAVEGSWAVVPFGGGTSVVGGVDPIATGHDAVLALNLTRMNRMVHLDRESRLATFQAGALGPAVEAALAESGFALGHHPQSFEFSTIGGWVATRSAGQLSTRYGKIEHLARAVRLLTPQGEWRTFDDPASATGPDLRQALIGSEGILGVILEVTVVIHPAPRRRWFRSFLFETFEEGIDAVRAILQAGLRPALVRLSDPQETELGRRLSGSGGWGWRLLRLLHPARARGAHLLLGSEEVDPAAGPEFRATCRRAAEFGGLPAGSGPGRHWFAHRFAHPYLRDELIDRSVFVETYETSAPWKRLKALYHAVRRAMEQTVRRFDHEPMVLAHLSHAYPDGASLYFTVLSRVRDGEEFDLWDALKRASCESFLEHGGTVTHHHAVGTVHRRWLYREHGPLHVEALRAIKRRLDPVGVMNPGKLLPDPR